MFTKFTKYGLILFALLIMGSALTQSQEQKKYYILFDNMEDQKDHEGTVITNLIDLCYYEVLSENPNFAPFSTRAPLSAATLAKHPVDDMDIAIFIMGKGKGLSHVQNGIKVFDLVQQMLKAGKRVLVIGHNLLSKDLDGNDQAIKDFYHNTLGVDEYIKWDLGSLPNPTTFELRGIDATVADGWPKYCNGTYARNNTPLQDPIRWYTEAEFFTIKSSANAEVMEYLQDPEKLYGKKVYTGLQAEIGDGKFVMWTVNYDIAAGGEVEHFRAGFNGTINWFRKDRPWPLSHLQYSPNFLDFEMVNVGDERTKILTIKNFGKEDFTLTDLTVDDPEGEGAAFTILDKEKLPVKLSTHSTVTFRVNFKSDVKKIYNSAISVHSDAANAEGLKILVNGSAGISEKKPAELELSDYPLDFGTLTYPKSKDLYLEVFNSGDSPLTLHQIEIVENTDEAFTIHQTIDMPKDVEPGTKISYKIRFWPLEESEKTFTGKIKINSNGFSNQGAGFVDLIGKSAVSLSPAQVDFSANDMVFGVVDTTKTMTITLTNTGEKDLYIQTVSIEADPETKESFELIGTPVPPIGYNQTYDVGVKFIPKKQVDYNATLKIISNSKMYGNKEIPISGTGGDVVGNILEDGFEGISGLFKMRVNPNPVTDNAILEYTLMGEASRNVELVILNSEGKELVELKNETTYPGTYTLSLDAVAKLANGAYIIAAKAGPYTTSMKFVISR